VSLALGQVESVAEPEHAGELVFGRDDGAVRRVSQQTSVAPARDSKAGLAAYTPDAGIKDVFFEIGGTMDLSDRWLLKAGGRYGRLLGDAADSPVVATENQFSGVLGLGYRFNLPQR
jgi:hypothetical protein